LDQALNALANFSIKGRKIFVMGDMLELGKRKEIFHCQAGRKAAGICDVFITVGELSKLSAKVAASSRLESRNILSCESAREARDVLFNKVSVREDDVVLVKGSRLMKMEEVFSKTHKL
jgi:UDP-N-acetylmuramoyl-tripeptide--D-alanyl-D-alanine ligase